MTSSVNPSDIYTDTSSLTSLKAKASRDASAALEETAGQFESLFIHMMLKTMRSTSLGDGLFDSEQTQFYQQMFDQQISVEMAKKRQVGIADMLVSQLGSQQGVTQDRVSTDVKLDFDRLRLHRPITPVAIEAFAPAENISRETIKGFDSPEDFVEKLMPLAEKHAAELGVSPKVLLAQAALETGWGKHVIHYSNGVPSHNLFNIKADQRWDGPRAVVPTLEYEKGKPVREMAAFRAYPSFEASFSDYVSFLKSSPRYEKALEQTDDSAAFVRALHQAGYATDPKYSSKINRIMNGDVFERVAQGLQGFSKGPLT